MYGLGNPALEDVGVRGPGLTLGVRGFSEPMLTLGDDGTLEALLGRDRTPGLDSSGANVRAVFPSLYSTLSFSVVSH